MQNTNLNNYTQIAKWKILILKYGNDCSIVKLRYSETSPITLKIEDEEIILIYNNEKANLKVELVEKIMKTYWDNYADYCKDKETYDKNIKFCEGYEYKLLQL